MIEFVALLCLRRTNGRYDSFTTCSAKRKRHKQNDQNISSIKAITVHILLKILMDALAKLNSMERVPVFRVLQNSILKTRQVFAAS